MTAEHLYQPHQYIRPLTSTLTVSALPPSRTTSSTIPASQHPISTPKCQPPPPSSPGAPLIEPPSAQHQPTTTHPSPPPLPLLSAPSSQAPSSPTTPSPTSPGTPPPPIPIPPHPAIPTGHNAPSKATKHACTARCTITRTPTPGANSASYWSKAVLGPISLSMETPRQRCGLRCGGCCSK